MPLLHTGPEKARFLIRAVGDAVPLADFLNSIVADASVEIIDKIGPPGQPHTLVAAMSVDRAGALEQQFSHSHQLIIEQDRPLSLFF